jgi:hypothetical protein
MSEILVELNNMKLNGKLSSGSSVVATKRGIER